MRIDTSSRSLQAWSVFPCWHQVLHLLQALLNRAAPLAANIGTIDMYEHVQKAIVLWMVACSARIAASNSVFVTMAAGKMC